MKYTKRQIEEAIAYWESQLENDGEETRETDYVAAGAGQLMKMTEAGRRNRVSDGALMQAYWRKCQEICGQLGLTATQESEQWDRDYICYYIRDRNGRPGNFYFRENDDREGTWEALIQARPVADGEYSVYEVMGVARQIDAEN